MTNLDVSNSSTGSSSGTSSDSSSSGSSSTSSTASSSSDSDTSSDSPAVTAAAAPKSPTKNNIDDKKKDEKQRRPSIKAKVSSSSEDDNQKTENNKIPPPRRRSSAKLRNSLPNSSKANCKPIPKTLAGNKTPRPSTKLSQKSSIKSSDSRNSTPSLKKKSIFSPDNSSESDTEDSRSKSSSNNNNNNKSSPHLRSKSRQRRSSIERVKPLSLEKRDERNHRETNHVKRRSSGNRSNGPPSKKVVEDKSATSSSSSQSSSELDTPDSDSEPSKNQDSSSRSLRSKQSSVNKSTTSSTSNSNSINDKDLEAVSRLASEASMGAVPRKLTRSLSARVSRMAAAARAAMTDTDSETDDKHSSIDLKKGGRKVLRSPVLPPTPPEACEPQERCCPVRGCDSSGHLGGEHSRHFTWDACPLYHNVSSSWCVSAGEERGAAASARRRAMTALTNRAQRAMPSLEQRAYRLKVKDMRSKWKSQERQSEDNSEELSTEREPSLEGFAPDYDLRLFREAQALAAIKIEDELEDLPSDRGTRYVVMGKYRMEVWYQSPYPGAAARAPRLFVCEYCLQHQPSRTGHHRHTNKCTWKHPPGDEVYRKDKLSVWQVDGRRHKQYCQQLCLLAKFFLDHKTLYYDVEPFLFYVMTIADNEGCHIVGYFSKQTASVSVSKTIESRLGGIATSILVYTTAIAGTIGRRVEYTARDRTTTYESIRKADLMPLPANHQVIRKQLDSHKKLNEEKNSFLNYNVSCILTLPPYQRQGYGRLLIDFSYLLTKVEGKVGSPETPLSDLGLISYRSYWKDVLLRRLCSAPGPTLSIRDLSKDLAIASCDIVSTLQERGLMKYWKGKHIVLKKQEVLEEMSRRGGRSRCVSPSCLRWSPPAPPPPR